VATPLATHQACVTGTVTLLDEARKANVRRVVYAASSSAYGNQEGTAKRETDLPAPRSPYAAAKLAGEQYCEAFYHTYGLETVSIRYFNVFGPRQDPDSPYSAVIPLFVAAMLNGQPPTVHGDGGQSRDFTYIDNVVHGNMLAADADGAAGRTINVACGRQTNLLELIAAINRLLRTSIEPVHTDPRPGDVRTSLADLTLARELLGYEPTVDFDEGLSRSIEYYRALAKA
jgi:UDP-glucose 4-epimerase